MPSEFHGEVDDSPSNRHNQTFREWALERCSREDHALNFLTTTNENGEPCWHGNSVNHGVFADAESGAVYSSLDRGEAAFDTNGPSVEVDAGHMVSKSAAQGNLLALENRADNRDDGRRSESRNVAFEKDAVLIEGVPIERDTAAMWESAGLLEAGTVDAAESTYGWSPVTDDVVAVQLDEDGRVSSLTDFPELASEQSTVDEDTFASNHDVSVDEAQVEALVDPVAETSDTESSETETREVESSVEADPAADHFSVEADAAQVDMLAESTSQQAEPATESAPSEDWSPDPQIAETATAESAAQDSSHSESEDDESLDTAEDDAAEDDAAEDDAAEDAAAEDDSAEDDSAEDDSAEEDAAEEDAAEDNSAEDDAAEYDTAEDDGCDADAVEYDVDSDSDADAAVDASSDADADGAGSDGGCGDGDGDGGGGDGDGGGDGGGE